MPEGKPGEFKTSLMGFKKADVLAYVDELAAKSLAEQQEHEQKAAQLQKELDGLRADNDLLMEKTRECATSSPGKKSGPLTPKRAPRPWPNSFCIWRKRPIHTKTACSLRNRKRWC